MSQDIRTTPQAATRGFSCVRGGERDEYAAFLQRKAFVDVPTGIEHPVEIHPTLFPFQRDIVGWALRRGRAAIFADTGLGKTLMQLEWARHVQTHTGGRVLILAPLAVASQTVREGRKIGLAVSLCRDASDVQPGVNITNYDRMHLFDPSGFDAIVLDESSCLKDYTSQTRNQIIEGFARTPFRLACTATPSPNDFTELGNHSEFLGVMKRTEMLSMFFVHDGGSTQDWRIKGHAEKDFWSWVCSWGAVVRKPSDLGYEDGAFLLPKLEIIEHLTASDIDEAHAAGKLFVVAASTLEEQRAARRASLRHRVEKCASIVNASSGPFLVWCELNVESDELTKAIIGAVSIEGSDDRDVKEQRLIDFSEGRIRVLVTKPSIAGYGMNWQHCRQMSFVGISHSFEQFYQACRRCWRFGQKSQVQCHVITSEAEGSVLSNLKRKEANARHMQEQMAANTKDIMSASIKATRRDTAAYAAYVPVSVPDWLKENE